MKEDLEYLFDHKTLTSDRAKALLVNIAEGKYNNSQLASFLTVFIMRSITVEELGGFRDALLELCVKVDLSDHETVDLCGTGGDGKDTFNISTLASFVTAGAGVKVAKHGNYGVSSSCGSSNVIQYLGYEFTGDPDQLRKQIDIAGICFLHAPMFHPAMKNIAPIRKEMGVKTFFNMLGPMVNPSFPKNQVVGVFNLELARKYAYLYQSADKRYSIIHALDGYDEISLTGDFKVISNGGEQLLSPGDLGMDKVKASDLSGGSSIEEAGKIFVEILKGKGTKTQNDVVAANAGMAINCVHQDKSIIDCIGMATESIKSGAAYKCLNNLLKA